ncbi:MAG: STAS domain-containing protein [Xanthomonadaceae bacterium]|jgi:ABC-type transporter Mla MlaB component|nr:STAS domain-containing protein [Xanthomonadaceae bacterium]MDE3072760.1 STAS domain-containing protein [Pseudomonadota bacterium]
MAGKRAIEKQGACSQPQAAGSDMPQSVVVTLPADCRMAAQAQLLQELLAALDAGAIELDGRAVERVDTAALQLLTLFKREVNARGGMLNWMGASEALDEAAGLLGLAKTLELPAAVPA